MFYSHFILLARRGKRYQITVCRHGIVHLMWRNASIQLRIANFDRLAVVLERGKSLNSSIPLCEGDFCVAIEDRAYRVSMGSFELVLSAEEYLTLSDMALEAAHQLARVLASDDWQAPEPTERPAGPLEGLYPHHFSLN